MTFTSGGHAAFERMMRGIPCHDKAPLTRSDLYLDCERCVHFCPESFRCRYCRCPFRHESGLFCGTV